ncbi:Histone chaperone domain CHZ [Dillenia turbinata]|uniref:Histone chaperone domain CHZ n=1 Tax=Dillenia turbinata TaxID=194707 RepID=A0AAN8VTL5_9MAGN
MAEEVTTRGEKVKELKEKEKAPQDVESQIKTAMRSRVAHFKEQADSLTFEGVRRLLEKDMGMETYALDVHKRFIKQCLVECLESSDDDNVSKNSCETEERTVRSAKGEAAESSDRLQPEKDVKEPRSEDEKMEDSPVFGLLTGNKTTKPKVEACQGIEDKGVPDENTIRKALMKRVSYFRANSQKITMAEVRRLLEQDLELDKNSLDPYKKLISELVEKILESPKAAKVYHEKSSRKNSKESSGSSNNDAEEDEEEDSSNSDGEEEEEEEEVKPKKRITPKGKVSEGLKKRQQQEETKVPRKKQKKQARAVSEKNSDSEGGGIVSEDGGDSRLSMEKQVKVKMKEAAAPAYGKRVEHLKSVIKSCGMSVPPSVYRRVKQAPENKREAHLIKELEEILSKEGLSTNPSEKEIKEVRRKKERARELEGIDTSNIVLTSRRRSTTTFVAPQKPKITEESDEEDESDDESDNEDDDDEDNDDGNEDNDEDEGDDESQSEDNEDNDDDSD